MEKMRALVFKDVGNMVMEEKPIPRIQDPDDVLLKIRAVGICGSDVKIVEGKHHFKPNTILGHEFCGEWSRSARTCSMSNWETASQSIITSAVDFARFAAWD